MGLEQDIADWVATRPDWQREAMYVLATEHVDIDELADRFAASLVAGAPVAARTLKPGDVPHPTTAGSAAVLHSISPVEHVNALAAGQCLELSTSGITVVYGDNASGKSGYARLVKSAVGARHQEVIRSNVFVDGSGDRPRALVRVGEGDVEPVDVECPTASSPLLGRIRFFDEACGDHYIEHESEITYRPSALVLFDRLIALCDAIKARVDQRLAENAQRKAALPSVSDGTTIRRFLDQLKGDTTEADVDNACALPDDVDEQIHRLRTEEAGLLASNPEAERKRFEGQARSLTTIASHVTAGESIVGDAAAKELLAMQRRATDLRNAATVASASQFDAEPLPGVGSETWRALWEAARRYSEAVAYPEHEHPHLHDGARCVLCQQVLVDDASSRLQRFQDYVSAETERDAREAERALTEARQRIVNFTPRPSAVAVAVEDVRTRDDKLARDVDDVLAALEERKRTLERGGTPVGQVDSVALATRTSHVAAELVAQAAAVDTETIAARMTTIRKERSELEGRQGVLLARASVMDEITRRREREVLESAKRLVDTTGITRQSSELTKSYVTAVVHDRFTRETDRLRLERIHLADVGGRKGSFLHRPALLAPRQAADISDVFSEGEQTALGLAGFITEAVLDESRSAIVLDDPVSSLDHIRRGHVARRLCELAQDRQVVVFTHDVSFVVDLSGSASDLGVALTCRAIERHGDGSIGNCRSEFPWSAKDVPQRLHYLETELARIRRERAAWNAETYEQNVALWAGSFSETLERVISVHIANALYDQSTGEVHPTRVSMLANFTPELDTEYQRLYKVESRWAKRHDKSVNRNYVPPEPDEMDEELKKLRTWFNTVKKL